MTAGDDGRIRGFAPFPRGARARRSRSWWGDEWLATVEQSADAESLKRGRAAVHAGRVGSLTVSPGRVAAVVYSQDGAAYDAVVTLDELTAGQWERFVAEVAERAGYVGALLEHDMPRDLVDAAADAGVPLLPETGDLESDCSCDEIAAPCSHATALCYQVAWLLDDDPFVIVLLRGRSDTELLQLLHARSAATSPTTVTPVAQETASAAYDRGVHALPAPPPLPTGQPRAVDVPSALGVDSAGIRWLAADAAVRAREWLASGQPPPQLDAWHDSVRLAATHRDRRLFTRLRDASGRPDELARAARSWEYGGAAGLDVLENPRGLTKREAVAANVSIAAAWDDEDAPEFGVSGNRWTLVGRGLQVRYGRDERWYPYRDEGGEWWPAGPPQADPAAALADLL